MFTTFGVRSHMHAQVPLAWALRAAGHDVCIASHPNLAEENHADRPDGGAGGRGPAGGRRDDGAGRGRRAGCSVEFFPGPPAGRGLFVGVRD